MRNALVGLSIALATAAQPTAAAETATPGLPAAEAAAAKDMPRLPPPASIRQSIRLNGATLNYKVTAGALPIRDDRGRVIAEVAYTAYLVDGAAEQRPVTFVFNGGPGGASAILNLGALGPKRLAFAAPASSASKTGAPQDNPGTWLDMTDLVFVDPVATGYSRSYLDREESKKAFFNTDADINYLSSFVYDWLSANGRMVSPKYLAGESYGGFRVPRMIRRLQSWQGVGIRAGILISPFLDSGAEFAPGMSPIPWAITLPGMAAAKLEREGNLDAAHMAPVIDYARDTYLRDFVRRRSDPGALDRMTAQVSAFTGLSESFVRQSGAQIEVPAFLREAQRQRGKVGSSIDPNFVAVDPNPFAVASNAPDPVIEAILGPITTTMVDFLSNQVGWKVDAPYYAVNFDVYGQFSWEGPQGTQVDSNDIRRIVAADPKLRLMVAHGWSDLSTPFMGSLLLIDQLPAGIPAKQVQLKIYPGGHMFFTRVPSLLAFRQDAAALYRQDR